MSSITVILLIGVPTIIQLFMYGLQLPIFVIILSRVLYLSRLLGINISMNIGLVLEGLTFFWMLVRPILFQKPFNKIEFVVFLIAFIFVTMMEFINESLYIYEDVSIEEYNQMVLKSKVFEELDVEHTKKTTNKKKKKKGRKR